MPEPATISRHRTIAEIAADLKAAVTAIQTAAGIKAIETLPSSSYEATRERMDNTVIFPAVLILAGAGEYQREGSSQRVRELDLYCLVLGDYSADPAAGAALVWDIIDRIARAFFPQTAGSGPITINGVRYHPEEIQMVPAGPDRCALALKLHTIDPIQTRANPDYIAPTP